MALPKIDYDTTIAPLPHGADAHCVATILQQDPKQDVLIIVRDDKRMDDFKRLLGCFCPNITLICIPAWDCLPYDRVSPSNAILSERLQALNALEDNAKRRIVLTTLNASMQRSAPKNILSQATRLIQKGDSCNREELIHFLCDNGYYRSATANEPGEFAVRGGLVDVAPSGEDFGIRIDFFGDEIDSIRRFDLLTQLSDKQLDDYILIPASEILLSEDTITRFRGRYRELFGAVKSDDTLYEAISEARRYAGMEHWLPLFYETTSTIFDYFDADKVLVLRDHLLEEALEERLQLIKDHYDARNEYDYQQGEYVYHPVPTQLAYLADDNWHDYISQHTQVTLSPFVPDAAHVDPGYKAMREFFIDARQSTTTPVDAMMEFLSEHRIQKAKSKHASTQAPVCIACHSQGSLERMQHILEKYHAHSVTLDNWQNHSKVKGKSIGLITLPLEKGFSCNTVLLISESDILGERIGQKQRKKASDRFVMEATSLSPGEYVVHKEHGIGRFDSLETLTVTGTKHDCLKLIYADNDILYLPVENIDLLSRYGGEDIVVQLDRLGSASWQARKSKIKKRITIAAEALIKIAAERALKKAPELEGLKGLYDEFCARFPYAETEDQLNAIADVESDLVSGKPMDRLICGDVGFGKTEVALRAAFIAASSGKQVAMVAPTTLLARQHYFSFKERFANMPINIRQLSRMVTTKDKTETKKALTDGTADIVIGTHALLAKSISFKNLGLVIIDEEQLFGVGQKERLKELKSEVHTLSLSATPIPRTLQMSLSGIKELSLIATPPVDRLAVRSFTLPYDPVVIRDAILREHYRGGSTFYVAPRIKDLDKLEEQLRELVPEAKLVKAHGKMPPAELDEIMNAFYDGTYDVLLSTNIVGSGLDVKNANTIIIHRADMFGLAQLYQLRGRVGRGKIRAYAYFTTPPKRTPTDQAIKRLEVMHNLDTLGAGFTVASHDMDIRGFGNLLGEEQSGQIKEVGIELYQEMLKEAVEALRRKATSDQESVDEEDWSPHINIGISILIPDSYVEDLSLRMGLYRRLSELTDEDAIANFQVELTDRFGSPPEEVQNLLAIVHIKQLCKQSGIAKLDVGPKGMVISFHNNAFKNPEALMQFIGKNPIRYKVRPDQTLLVKHDWQAADTRIEGTKNTLCDIIRLAA